MHYQANATTVYQFGQPFVVIADSVEQRRMVETRARLLWLDHWETKDHEWQKLDSIHADDWLL